MKLITIRSQIRDVVQMWPEWQSGSWNVGAVKRIGNKLKDLDVEKATPKDIEKITGGRACPRSQKCDECGGLFDVVVEVGEELDYESNTATMCAGCLEDALKLARSCEEEEQECL